MSVILDIWDFDETTYYYRQIDIYINPTWEL